ncbi:MAG: sigma-70 family RNA polymerase sigma factor [Candidatus Margulisbacteria bacterium]|nr:sigma-70 family RNA polymerase sigma factor [Candidatus Margulisiibacteriota bacterium]
MDLRKSLDQEKESSLEIDVDGLRAHELSSHKSKKSIPEKFVKMHFATVKTVASKLASGRKLPPGIVFNDLVSWGVEGLIKARELFDAKKGAKFVTYASIRIKGEILDKIREEWQQRSPSSYRKYKEEAKERIAQLLEGHVIGVNGPFDNTKGDIQDLISGSAISYSLSLENIDTGFGKGKSKPEFVENMEKEENNSILWEAVDKELNKQEVRFVNLFYRRGMSQKAIASKLKMSQSKISRMHHQVLNRLKNKLKQEYDF